MKWTNESSSIQTKKGKHHSEAFGITDIPGRLRYSPDSSNAFMRKQRQVSGAALGPASVRLVSLRNVRLGAPKGLSGIWQHTRNQAFTETDARPYELWHIHSTRLCVTFLGQPAVPGMTWNTMYKSYPAPELVQMGNVCECLNCRWSTLRGTGCKMNHIFSVHLWSPCGFWCFAVFDGWSLKLLPLKSNSPS